MDAAARGSRSIPSQLVSLRCRRWHSSANRRKADDAYPTPSKGAAVGPGATAHHSPFV